MLTHFSKTTVDALGSYVYVYKDPNTNEPFYVGKGKNQRVFDHLSESGNSAKAKKLADLKKQGKEPIIDILIHGLDDETAKNVEMAVIDLIGKEKLTNEQRGENADKYGRLTVQQVETRYGAEELAVEKISERAVLLNINKLYTPGMSAFKLYEATRGYWVVSPEKVKNIEYAMAVYEGIVLETYKVTQWFPAASSMRSICRGGEDLSRRYEFIGVLAEDEVRKKYNGKSVKHLFNNANPVRYVINGDVSEDN